MKVWNLQKILKNKSELKELNLYAIRFDLKDIA